MITAITEELPAPLMRSKMMKLSLNVDREMGEKIRTLAFNCRLSESSIVDVALTLLVEGKNDEEIEQVLLANGACLRRKTEKPV